MMKKKTILLVEDEIITALTEEKTLKHFGYDVVTADSGREAVTQATTNEKINLILMDIDLGEGINGPEAAEQILKSKTIPIVFLTSHSSRDMVEKVRGITRYGYVIKNSGDFVLQSSIEMAFELFEAHQQVRESEDRYRAITECSHNSICIVNEQARITWFNDEMLSMGGYTRAQLMGAESFVAFLAPESIEFVFSNFKTFLAGEPYIQHYNFHFIRADGEKRLCEKNMTHFTDTHGRRNLVISMKDITD